MRLLPLFLLIFLFFDVNEAQRRTTAKPDSSSVTPRTASRGRGRSRFVSTPDYEQSQGSGSIPQEPTGRRVSSRKRVTENTEQRIPPRVVGALLKTESFARVPNVTPKTETLPRVSNSATKPERTSARVANSVPRAEVAEKKSSDRRAFSSRTSTTESSQRSQSLNPSKNSYEVQEVIDEPVAFEPIRRAKKLRLSTSENQQNDLKSIPRRNSLHNLPTESPEAFKSTVKNSATSESSVVSLPPEDSNIVEGADDTTLETLLEVSSESPVLPEEQPITPSSQIPDTPKTSEPVRGQSSRRNGARRTPGATDQTTPATRSRTRARASKTPEVLFEAAVPTRSSRRRTGGPSVFTAEVTQNEPRSRTGRTIDSSPEKVTINLTSRRGRRNSTPSSAPRTTTRTTASPRKRQPTERSSRSRSRSRDAPPVLDETKLEVLPLFEAEPSIVNSVRGRSRSRTVQPDNFLMSSTETNNRVTKAMPPKEVETATQVAARGESSRGKEVRQSVVAEVNQVVSRGTVSRKKSSTGVKIKAFDPLARGSKKAETRRSEKEKKNSSEEIEESDNYPEHFKALLKAKKGEESSAEKITRSGPTITNIVTASSFPSRFSSGGSSTTISYALKESNELDNELFPKTSSTTTPIPRTPRSRSSRTPSETLAPSTGTATTVPTRQKHSKNSELTRRTNGGVAFKPKEAGSRRDRDKSERGKQQQVPTKVSKLVSTAVNVDRRKYRSDLASRSALTRSTTNAPRYIPTIPSMPYVPTVPTFTPQRTSPEQSSLPSFEANPLSLNSGSTSTTAATNLASSSTPERSPRTNNRVFTSTTSPVSTTRPSATTAEVLAGTTRASAGTTEGSLSSTEVATEVLSGSTQTPMGTTLSGLVDMVTEESSTVTSTGPGTNPTLSALSELFDGRTLNALNEIVNSVKTNTDTVTTTSQVVKYNKVLNIQDLLNSRTSGQPFTSTRTTIFGKVDATTLQPEMSSTLSTIGTTLAPLTTTEILFTESADTVTTESSRVTISNDISEGKSSTEISTTSFPTTTSTSTTTTGRIPSTTKIVRLTTTPTNVQSTFPTRLPEVVPTAPLLPTFLTTLFPNLFAAEVSASRAPRVLTTKTPGIIRISAPPSVTENMLVAASTTRATTIAPPSTTVVPSTTTPKVTTRSTTTTTTTRATTTTPKATTTTQRTTTTPRATTTPQTTTARPTTESTTLPITTTNSVPSTSTVIVATTDTTTTESEILTNLNAIETTSKKPLKVLTAEQKENLKTLMQLEKEQAALLQQLSFLTNLNFGKAATPRKSNNEKSQKQTNKNLADRVVALAVERDKTAQTTTQKPPASIQDQLAAIDATRKPKQVTPSIEEVLRQYNLGDLDIATTPGTSYGKSNDAILASLLKQQGIAPPTPKSLADQIKQAGLFDDPTTRKPKPKPKPRPKTTPPPGRLMQGLNWLLNALAPTPPPTPRPTRKPAKPKRPPVEQQEELLTNSPTHVTPVVTAAPSKLAGGASSKKNMLSQEDIQKLIAQLEGLQKDSNKQSLDLSQIKSLQNLINTDEGVVVLANGEHGSTPRRTATPTGTRTTTARPTSVGTTRRRQERKLTTVSSNRLEEEEDEFEVTTKKHKAPIGFRPVPGVDDESSESLVRSNLITAAVNVTKAISGFLGTALQGAAQSFQTLWGSGSALGSRVLGAASGSSGGPG